MHRIHVKVAEGMPRRERTIAARTDPTSTAPA